MAVETIDYEVCSDCGECYDTCPLDVYDRVGSKYYIAHRETALYIVGRYEDALIRKSGRWLYSARKAIADTRVVDSFTHLPV